MIPKGKTERGSALLSNIIGSGAYKFLNVIITLLIFRYSILLIGEEKFGVWLALLSFLTWFSALEVGLSNGIRNQITQLFADKEYTSIKTLIEKAYKSLILIYFVAISIILTLSFFIPLDQLFISSHIEVDFLLCFQICVGFYFLHYILFFIHNVLLATHKTKYTYLGYVFQNGTILLGIASFYYLNFTPSLLLFCTWFSAVPLFSWAFVGWFHFKFSLKNIAPSFSSILRSKPSNISKTSKSFFAIQVCILTLFSTDNLIIINLLSGKDVSLFNISFKYFNVLVVIFNLILLPYWASFTDAFHKSDFKWINVHLKRLISFWMLMVIVGCVMLYFANAAFNLWIGKIIYENWNLSIFMLFSILLTMWISIFSSLLNSVSKVDFQLKLLFISTLINIPLTFYLTKTIGLEGAVLATCFVLLPLAIGLPLKTHQILIKLK